MKKSKILIGCLALVLGVSCTQDFEEINTNPNAPVAVQPELLLRQVIYDFGEQMSYEGFVAGDLLSQHRTAIDLNLFDRHALKSPQLGGNPWPIFYTNLRDNEILLKQSRIIETQRVYEGPALILKAYMAQGLTDLFGDVPYFEAFDGVLGTVTAAYDDQEDIYLGENGILDNIDKGTAALKNYNGAVGLQGDLLFGGNLDGWIKFANSLKLKALMRIAAKVDVADEVNGIFQSGEFIQANAENATFDFTASAPNSFRLAQLRVGDFNNFVLSETMDEILTQLDDPRLNTFFRTVNNGQATTFNGLINGIDASQTSIELGNYSLAGTAFRESPSNLDANFITAWETQFILAEAAEKGFISADAEALYELGVRQAFAYWFTELPSDYLEGPAAFNAPGTTPLQQIATQKWIANLINGYEGWIEFRRTGFPEFKSISASLNEGLIPVRMPYPADEAALNAANYEPAAAATGGNSLNVEVWWDEEN
ncbi:MAG: SusD/RagB family nutrient-binding outer membrane lipoprotein [Leeuwenhoekiella sp.]